MEKILKIYVSNTDTFRHQSVYELIARSAQEHHLQGCTVSQGIMGFGATGRLHSNKFWELNIKYPVTIEIIDEEQSLRQFIDDITPMIDAMPKGCLVTMQDVEVVIRKKGGEKK